jgi:DnaJ-class molecular chaperone
MAQEDYYSILGIGRDASEQDIKQAYRRMVKKYHPDVAEDKEKAQEEMTKVNEAYGVLSDPDKILYRRKLLSPLSSSSRTHILQVILHCSRS